MQTIQQLRRLTVRLDVSGEAAEVAGSFRLYKGGFGFMGLACYVPKTVNYTGKTLCTVFRSLINPYGETVPKGGNYNMLYVGEKKLDGLDFLLFECPCPKEFTETDGELTLTFNYCDISEQNQAVTILTTAQFKTTVMPGGWNNQGVALAITSGEAAQINTNTYAIAAVKTTADTALMKINKNEVDVITALEGTELAINQSDEALSKSNIALTKSTKAETNSILAVNIGTEAIIKANTAIIDSTKADKNANLAIEESNAAVYMVSNVRSPITGIVGSFQTAIDDMFNYTSYGITAGDFDGLNITASYYDDKNITALDFDTKSKFILIGGN